MKINYYFVILKENFEKSNNYVEVITLENYVQENNINQINICKIDTEGSDYNVVQGLSDILINKIDYLIFEYEENSYLKIYNFLNMNNYKHFLPGQK